MLFSDYLSLGDELERENIFDPILDSEPFLYQPAKVEESLYTRISGILSTD